MKIITVISNYNEEREIRHCIADFRKNSGLQSDLLVIDNSSTDGSVRLVREEGVDFLVHAANSGGSAGVIKTALAYCYWHGYDVYCHMDGDNQHNAAELQKLVAPVLEEKADIVIGSRFITREGFQSLFFRRMGIFSFSWLVSLLAKQPITDLTSGFRAYNRRAIAFFAHQYKHEFEACAQMLLIAAFAGLRIHEVPVVMKPRRSGKSQFNFIKAVKFPVYSLISIFSVLMQKIKIERLSHATQL